MSTSVMRTFETGATRDTDTNKIDYEGFLSPLVLERFGQYMHENRIQSDGQIRDSDNWQKGIPLTAYMKSLWRHFMVLWTGHRMDIVNDKVMEDTLCALLFNIQGYLHEYLRNKDDLRGGQTNCPSGIPVFNIRRVLTPKECRRDSEITPRDVNHPDILR